MPYVDFILRIMMAFKLRPTYLLEQSYISQNIGYWFGYEPPYVIRYNSRIGLDD